MKANTKFLLAAVHIGVNIVLLVFLAGPAIAQTPAPAAPADAPVARLGTMTIGQGEVQRLLQDMPPAERAAIRSNRAGVENWLRQRLTSEAVLKEARSKGWADRPEIKARIDAAVREISARVITAGYLESVAQVPADYPSETETKSAYDQDKAKFNIPVLYHVAQIFLAAPKGDAAAIAKVRHKAKKLAANAREGDFATIARANSQDASSAAHGGDVGKLPLESILPEMRDIVGKMKAGEISDPIQSADGFHIVKLIDSQAARNATYDEVKPRLQTFLRQQRQQQMLQAYLASLAPANSLTIDNAALDAVLSKVN